MRTLKSKPCAVCSKIYTPTGTCSKYCSKECRAKVWTRAVLSQRTYDWQVAKGIIKNPGVGTGHAQGTGVEHHSFKATAPHRYRDYVKTACEKCGSTKYLCGHHLDHNRSNNNPENIQTLCKRCHQVEHKCYLNFKMSEAARKAAALRMKTLNKILPRKNGKNTKQEILK